MSSSSLRRRARRASFAAGAAALLAAPSALADKVAVLPFSPTYTLPKPELDEARRWTREAVAARGHTLPSAAETASAELAVKDGVPDTGQEYRAAGAASGAAWTLTARVERVDVKPKPGADGEEAEDGYTLYRMELEACQMATGRVESLAREIDPDAAPAEIGEMLALLVRPEGIANADIPWTKAPRKRRAKPSPPALQPVPAAPPPPAAPPAPVRTYAEGRPVALGVSLGVSNALARPELARGPSWALPIGAAAGYALDALPGLELRGIFTSQVVGPKAVEIAAGARYALPVLPRHRVFVGPELLGGVHVAIGADPTARLLARGAAFAAIGLGERVQLEIEGDLGAAFGGSGTLVLGGGTARALVRF